jgi:hypothetical protein
MVKKYIHTQEPLYQIKSHLAYIVNTKNPLSKLYLSISDRSDLHIGAV